MNLTMFDASALGRSSIAMFAISLATVISGCSGEEKSKAASQTAAKVNKDEVTVHQINFILQQRRNLRPEQTEAASQQILDGLIDQQLALQKANDLKVDRDPRVMQQVEASRREIVARAYLEKIGDAAPKPSTEEIKKYYDDKPALFRERRIYSIQEIAIEATPEQQAELRNKLASSKNINEFVEFLKSKEYRFNGNQAVRAAEQLPLNSLESFSKMKDGQAAMVPAASGVQVIVLASSRSQPASEEQARPAIEQFLFNERKRKLIEEDMKAVRSAAKIEYVGKFAQAASGAASGAARLVEAPASAASGNDTDAIRQGLGLKK